jgi:hypothetical protein
MEKVSASGEVSYYLQAEGAALVHPDFKDVIPFCPEIIRKQDDESEVFVLMMLAFLVDQSSSYAARYSRLPGINGKQSDLSGRRFAFISMLF